MILPIGTKSKVVSRSIDHSVIILNGKKLSYHSQHKSIQPSQMSQETGASLSDTLMAQLPQGKHPGGPGLIQFTGRKEKSQQRM